MEKELKTTIDVVVGANSILDKADLSKLTGKEKIAVVRVMKAMRPIAKAYNDADELIRDKMKGEKHDEMIEIYNDKNKSDEEKAEALAYVQEYVSNIQKSEYEELKKEVTVTIPALSENDLTSLLGCLKDVNGAQTLELYDFLLEDDKPKEAVEEVSTTPEPV